MIFISTAAHERLKTYHKEATLRQVTPRSRQRFANILRQLAIKLDDHKSEQTKGGSYVHT